MYNPQNYFTFSWIFVCSTLLPEFSNEQQNTKDRVEVQNGLTYLLGKNHTERRNYILF